MPDKRLAQVFYMDTLAYFSEHLWLLLGLMAMLGALAGFMSGLLGIGGGLILVPSFYFGFAAMGYDPAVLMHVAVGTSLAVIAPTGLSAARAHWRRGAFDLEIFNSVAPGMFLGALSGVFIADMATAEVLQYIFAAAVFIVAMIMFTNPARFKLFDGVPPIYIALPCGLGIGIAASLMGIAGALLMVPFLSVCGVAMHKAVGTASAIGVVVSIPAALGFVWIGLSHDTGMDYMLGYIHWLAFLTIIPFTMLAAPLGAKVAHSVSIEKLRLFFAFFMLVVAVRMLIEAVYG